MQTRGRRLVVGGTAVLVVVAATWASLALADLSAAEPPTGPAVSTPSPVPAAAVEVLVDQALPPPRSSSDVSLEEALVRRGSVREFSDEPVSGPDLGQLLWAAQGEREGPGRTAPSAGGLLPLEVYVVARDGVWHYQADGHRLGQVRAGDFRDQLAVAALDQRAFHSAPAVVAIAGVEARMTTKYHQRGRQYVMMEAGHAMQNLLLQAAALGLGAVPTGAFRDDQVAAILDLPTGSRPLYLAPVGHPAPGR